MTLATEVPYSVFSCTSAMLSIFAPGGLHVLQEVEIDLGEVACHRRRAEEPFEAALGEIGRDQLAVDRNGMPYFSAIALAVSVMPD